MSKIYPFKFLDAYGKDDTHLFFGRNDEIGALYQMIFQTNILMVYGASGTGKTSLVQCGLAGKFQNHEWLSLFIRRGNDINIAFEKAIADAGGNDVVMAGTDLMGMAEEGDGTLTAAKTLSPLALSFQAIYLRSFCPVYLIFDQFEELFILGTKQEQEQFIKTVQEILKLQQPVKMIFSIREEYLGHLYEFEKAVPQLMRKKLRVEPMNRDKVHEVIRGVTTFEDSNVRIKPGEEKKITESIFDKIKGKDKSLTIQLPYLQVFLDKLYEESTHDESHQAEAVFTMETLNRMGDIGDVLREFLEEQVAAISIKLSTGSMAVTPDTIWKILSPFATLEGTKEPTGMTALLDRVKGVNEQVIKDTVTAFVNSRILRHNEDSGLYELSHDTLAGQVAAKRSDEEIALLEVKRLIKSQAGMKADAMELFSEKQLNFIEPYLNKITVAENERTLIDKSRKDVAAKKKKRYWTWAIICSILVAAVAYTGSLAYWANGKRNEALNAKMIADSSAHLADQRLLDLVKQQAISKAKEIESFGDSYKDNGDMGNALLSYRAALKEMESFRDDKLYTDIKRKTDSLSN